ncbi:PIN domain-containing protein [Streptomyces tricolor]|uniref:PIN domain-containing protein n=1 Tax=Streptomyces tricolor TaxID=68277 RepID=UPI0036EC3BAD
MDLARGVKAAEAVAVLRGLIDQASALRSGLQTQDASEVRDAYLAWAADTEERLAELTDDDAISDRVLSTRHWRIVDAPCDAPHLVSLLDAELKAQVRWLERSVHHLETQIKKLEEPIGDIFLLDSNIFLQFRVFTEIDWCKALSCDVVRLIVPLTVLTELDDKKSSSKSSLGNRAHKVLSLLHATLGGSAAGPSRLRDGVTIEVMDRERTTSAHRNADDEILSEAQYLTQMLGRQGIAVVSDDTSLRLRAAARGLRAVAMPEEFRIVDTSEKSRSRHTLKLTLLSESGMPFLDPGNRSVLRINAAATVRRVIASVEPLPVPKGRGATLTYGYGRDEAEHFNRQREAWIVRMKEWAEHYSFLRSLSERAARLPLMLVNAETVPIHNVQIELRLARPDTSLRFAVERDFKARRWPDPPREPGRFPVGARLVKKTQVSADPRSERHGWRIAEDRCSAVMEVDKIWQGQSLPLDADVCVVDPASDRPVGGFALSWKVLTSDPVATITGTIGVRPRRSEPAR